MNRPPFIPCLLVLLLMNAAAVFAGTTTLTTYYPAPSGNYNQLRLVPLDTPPASCPVGTLYADSATGKLMYCGAPGAWEYADVWTQSGSNVSPVTATSASVSGLMTANGIQVNGGTVSLSNGASLASSIANLTITGSGAGARVVQISDTLTVTGALQSGDLNVSGNILATGSVTASSYFYSSDQRLKKNIHPIAHALDKIQHLNGVRFTWKKNNVKDIGVIAQNVEAVVPELVTTDKNGMKSVAYGNLTALLIEAVKEQQKQIEDLKKQVAKLQK